MIKFTIIECSHFDKMLILCLFYFITTVARIKKLLGFIVDDGPVQEKATLFNEW